MKTSAITLGHRDVPAVMVFYAIYIVIWLLDLYLIAQAAIVFIVAAAALGQVAWHYRLIRHREREGCFTAFRANHWLGFTFFAGIVLAARGQFTIELIAVCAIIYWLAARKGT
jgi:4-hydroxybenzoate polyprenyltransferase